MGGIFNNSYSYKSTNYGVEGHPTQGPKFSSFFAERSSGNNKAIILPTVLRVTTEEIQYWTNITCFYDKNWQFDPTLSTVPISFMHITSVTEIISAQGAEKRVILYEAPESSTKAGFAPVRSHPSSENNLRVIMDNVIVQPKQYQMEVIIPDSLIGPFHKQGLARLEALISHVSQTLNDSWALKLIGSTLRYVQVAIGVVEKVSNMIDLLQGGSSYASSAQIATINKNSLQAMASRGHVILFKKWTGFDYSYGIITKVDISKKPSEDGVYRGSITFQETPILNISQKNVSHVIGGAITTNAARVVNLALAFPFLKLTGVMEEAGAPGSKNNKKHSFGEWQSSEIFKKGGV
jgi:hypothetical protein